MKTFNCPDDKKKALDLLKKHVGLPLLDKNEIFELFNQSNVPWENTTKEAQIYMVGELARALGKVPENLNANDFLIKLPVFDGKSLRGYVNWIKSAVPGNATSIQKIKAHLGIRIHESLVLQFYINSSGTIGFWEITTQEAQAYMIGKLARALGKVPEDLNADDFLIELPVFGGKSLRKYTNWIKRTVPGNATPIQKIRAHLGIQIHESLVLQFYINSPGNIVSWEITTEGAKLLMMRELAAALNKKPIALQPNDFYVPVTAFAGNNLRGLLDWAMKTFNCPDDEETALDLLKKHVGLPLIDKNGILELFKKGRPFWANTTKAAKLYMVELLARACDKVPGALNTNDFNRKKPLVFNGKNLDGLLNWAKMEFKCASPSVALTVLKDYLRIAPAQKPVLALSSHDLEKTKHILRDYKVAKDLPDSIDALLKEKLRYADISALARDAKKGNKASYFVLLSLSDIYYLSCIKKLSRYFSVSSNVLFEKTYPFWDILDTTLARCKKNGRFAAYFYKTLYWKLHNFYREELHVIPLSVAPESELAAPNDPFDDIREDPVLPANDKVSTPKFQGSPYAVFLNLKKAGTAVTADELLSMTGGKIKSLKTIIEDLRVLIRGHVVISQTRPSGTLYFINKKLPDDRLDRIEKLLSEEFQPGLITKKREKSERSLVIRKLREIIHFNARETVKSLTGDIDALSRKANRLLLAENLIAFEQSITDELDDDKNKYLLQSLIHSRLAQLESEYLRLRSEWITRISQHPPDIRPEPSAAPSVRPATKEKESFRIKIASGGNHAVYKLLKQAETFINSGQWENCLETIIKILQIAVMNPHKEPNITAIRQVVTAYSASGYASEELYPLLEKVDDILHGFTKKHLPEPMRKQLKSYVRGMLEVRQKEAKEPRVTQKKLSVFFEKNTETDRNTILSLINESTLIDDAFTSIFRRPDLASSDVENITVSYLSEGRFKKVYKLRLKLQDSPYSFNFLVKAVKRDVVKSDTDYQYDMDYAEKLMEISRKAREKDFSLHVPMGGLYEHTEPDGKQRIVFSEALIPESIQAPSPEVKGRVSVAAYLRYWEAFDKKLFLHDPKPENVVIQKTRGRYKATIIDIDNVDFGRSVHPREWTDAFLMFGFSCENIVLGVIDVLSPEEAREFIYASSFILSQSGDARGKELLELFEIAKNDKRYRLPGPTIAFYVEAISVYVNGMIMDINEDVSLLDLLQDCSVDIAETEIAYNAHSLQVSDPKNKEQVLESIKLSHGDRIEFWHKSTVFDQPTLLPDGSPAFIFELLQTVFADEWVPAVKIRESTSGGMPDGHLSLETVNHDLGTLVYLGLVQKDGSGVHAKYWVTDLSPSERKAGQTVLEKLGARPSREQKVSAKNELEPEIKFIPADENIPDPPSSLLATPGIGSLSLTDNTQEFLRSVFLQAYESAQRDENVIIGIDTTWIPDMQKAAIQGLLNRLSYLSRRQGLGNIQIYRRQGTALATVLLKEAEKAGTPLSNVLILGDSKVLDSDTFSPLKNPHDGKQGAFFAKVILPDGFTETSYVQLLEMLTIAMKLAFGGSFRTDSLPVDITEDGRRCFIFTPRATSLVEDLKTIYDNQKTAITAA
ncbi:MAG: hypothetical protein ABIA77_01390 [Candidatus Omnitrophota bacterium]